MILNQLVKTIIKQKPSSKKELEKLKRSFAKKQGLSMPKNYQILQTYKQMMKANKVEEKLWFERLILAKPVRTLSGVTPLAVITKPYSCPGKCLYCPDQSGVPKSYLDDEPAILRAAQFNYDPQKQVEYRLKVFKLMGHRIAKIELIILGGTFSAYPDGYRQAFVKSCFDACNQKQGQSLEEVQITNEKARARIIGITIETRPDLIDKEEIRFLRRLGATRVELGVQSIYPEILKKVKRGHGLEEVATATGLLKNAGFKVCYHLMPGLPGSSFKKDVEMFKVVFSDSRFQPDYLKIYPCVVLQDAPLYRLWKKRLFKPLKDKELVDLMVEIKKIIPPYVRINRLGRDIPIGNVVAGYRYSHIRQLAQKKLKKQGFSCRCIRCREIRSQELSIRSELMPRGIKNYESRIIKYIASGGEEYFLQIVDENDRLYAMLRLRFPPKRTKPIFTSLKNAALIRELHTYGKSLKIGEEKKEASQHHGLGKKLMGKAEKIAQEKGFDQIAVIAGVGVRNYYRSLGYRLNQTYMIKRLV